MRKLLVVLTFIFSLALGFYYQNKALSFHFVDEEDNFVLGNYLLKGEKLYLNLFAHHQPLGYILSAGVQKATNPSSIFLLVKRHREFVILISIIASVLLVYRFGFVAFLFVITYETSKIFLLGNLFLSESLLIYPLVYIFLLSIFDRGKINKIEKIVIGILFSWCIFLLAPIWPLLVFLFVYLFYTKKWKLNDFGLILIGFVPIFLLCLAFSSVKDYLFDAIYINFKYYIPSDGTRPGLINLLKSIFSPLLVFIPGLEKTAILFIIQSLSLVLGFGLVFLTIAKKYKLVLTLIIVLALANIRFVNPGLDYYRGFHLLPWYALLICSVFIGLKEILNSSKNIVVKFFVISLGLLVLTVSGIKSGPILFEKDNLEKEWYINYSGDFDLGQAVKIMAGSTSNDKLFVIPDEWLVYWQSQLNHASPLVNYYPWMNSSPELKGMVSNLFTKNPPEYFYCNCSVGDPSYAYTKGYLNLTKNGNKTNLYVLAKKANLLNTKRLGELNYYGFKIVVK